MFLIQIVLRRKGGYYVRAARKDLVRRDIIGYTFVLPTLIAVTLFTVYPVFEALRISFFKHNGMTGWWVGLDNYKFVLTDAHFWIAVKNTIYMGVLSLVLGLPISLIVASLINNCSVGRNFFKSVYFIPNVTSIVAASLVFVFLLYPTKGGLVNGFLGILGIKPLEWFASSALAPIGVVLMELWRMVGYNAIIWLAGLQSIPKELYEASEVDGATKLKQWWYITIPGIKPIFVFLVIIGTINAFRRFGDVFVIGGIDGAPASSLSTMVLYIYKYGFGVFEFGKASAASYIVFVIILFFTIINFKLFNKED